MAVHLVFLCNTLFFRLPFFSLPSYFRNSLFYFFCFYIPVYIKLFKYRTGFFQIQKLPFPVTFFPVPPCHIVCRFCHGKVFSVFAKVIDILQTSISLVSFLSSIVCPLYTHFAFTVLVTFSNVYHLDILYTYSVK